MKQQRYIMKIKRNLFETTSHDTMNILCATNIRSILYWKKEQMKMWVVVKKGSFSLLTGDLY